MKMPAVFIYGFGLVVCTLHKYNWFQCVVSFVTGPGVGVLHFNLYSHFSFYICVTNI